LGNPEVLREQHARVAVVADISQCLVYLLDYCAVSNGQDPRNVLHDKALWFEGTNDPQVIAEQPRPRFASGALMVVIREGLAGRSANEAIKLTRAQSGVDEQLLAAKGGNRTLKKRGFREICSKGSGCGVIEVIARKD